MCIQKWPRSQELLTPVPGGVGPLTIAMLMFNTVKAAKMRREQWSVVSGQ